MEILIYLLKASAISTLFLIIYHVLLKHDTFHQFKRIYLMFGLLISAVLPWLYYTQTVIVETVSNNFSTSLLNAQISSSDNSNVVLAARDALTFSWDEIVLMLYLLVSSILLVRLIFNYAKLLFRLQKTSYKTIDNHKVHIVKESINPFSFFNHIVIGQKDYESKNFDIMFAHEVAHIKQWHSADILVANLFCVAFWFNPFVWFYKESLVQNLEHIADKVSVETLNDKLKYQYLLLSNSFSTTDLQTIQTTFFQSSIKQRIMMLNKSTTSKIYALKSIIVLPILILFFMNFQAKVVAQEKKSPWKTKATLNSVTYSDSIKTITTNYRGDEPNISVKKNELIVIKITKDATEDFLGMIKSYLKKQYDVDVKFSQIRFNKNNELTSIKAKINSNDGFKGSISRKSPEPIQDIYFYKEYKNDGASVSGFSEQLPESYHKKDGDNLSTTILLSSEKSSEKSTKKDYSIDSKIESSDKFESVKNLIINGKSFQTDELAKKAIVLKSYKFVDEMTVEAEGEIFENKDYWDYFDEKMETSKDNTIRNIKVLVFDKDSKPIFLNIDKLSATEEQSKNN